MTTTSTTGKPIRLRRLCPGSYETLDGVWQVHYHPAQRGHHALWAMFQPNGDGLGGDAFSTLTEARDALARYWCPKGGTTDKYHSFTSKGVCVWCCRYDDLMDDRVALTGSCR